MKIAVNARFLIKNKIEGIGRFTFETFKILTTSHPEVTFYFLFDRPYSNEFIFSSNIIPVILNPPARHPFLWILWFEFSVNRFLKKENIDLFISTDGYIPLLANRKTLAVIHDINFEHRPKDIPWLTRTYYKFFFPKFAKKSTRIATVSSFSKKDLINCYHLDPEKIDIVGNGVSELFSPLNDEKKNMTRNKITGGEPYFLYVGAIHQRKNITNLLLAFDEFCKKSNRKHYLVLTGKPMFGKKHLQSVYLSMTCKDKVVFTGWLSDNDLQKLLASAFALTFVPFFEGFGIPVIEAMKCGVPVICSNVTSLPEVAGDAALLVNPGAPREISNAMAQLVNDPNLRNELISKGYRQSSKFTWTKTAAAMWQSILKCMDSNE